MQCWGKGGGIKWYSKGEREERKGKGRETIKLNEGKICTFSHYNSFPQDTLYSSLSGSSFHLTCRTLPCPLIFTYPPELHLCLEHTVTVKDKVDMKLRENNCRGSNDRRGQDESLRPRTSHMYDPCIRRSA